MTARFPKRRPSCEEGASAKSFALARYQPTSGCAGRARGAARPTPGRISRVARAAMPGSPIATKTAPNRGKERITRTLEGARRPSVRAHRNRRCRKGPAMMMPPAPNRRRPLAAMAGGEHRLRAQAIPQAGADRQDHRPSQAAIDDHAQRHHPAGRAAAARPRRGIKSGDGIKVNNAHGPASQLCRAQVATSDASTARLLNRFRREFCGTPQ